MKLNTNGQARPGHHLVNFTWTGLEWTRHEHALRIQLREISCCEPVFERSGIERLVRPLIRQAKYVTMRDLSFDSDLIPVS